MTVTSVSERSTVIVYKGFGLNVMNAARIKTMTVLKMAFVLFSYLDLLLGTPSLVTRCPAIIPRFVLACGGSIRVSQELLIAHGHLPYRESSKIVQLVVSLIRRLLGQLHDDRCVRGHRFRRIWNDTKLLAALNYRVCIQVPSKMRFKNHVASLWIIITRCC